MRHLGKIALIAGGGKLPHEVIKGALEKNYKVFIAAINGFSNINDFRQPASSFSLGELGKLLKTFKQHKCTHVVFAGNISRPDFSTLKPDLYGLKFLPRAVKAASQGDDALLKFIISIFETEGFIVIAPQDLCLSTVVPKGILGSIAPDKSHAEDIDKALEIAAMIGASDIGQGAVVANGLVLAVEAQEGTDNMLIRVAALPKEIRGDRTRQIGVFAKRLKPSQEERIDLPTVGVKTVELASKAGLAGIVVEANKAFVLDMESVIETADKLGIFIIAQEMR